MTAIAGIPKHIGIVGCSAEGAALCYRTVCIEGARHLGPHAHPQVSLHTHSLADYVACLDRGDLDGVAGLMLDSARRLAASGADFLICPDNTIHQAFPRVAAASPRPWLHIAAVVAEEAKRRGLRRLALTGTHWLVNSEVYPEQLAAQGVGHARPSEAERQAIGRIIMDELVKGVFRPESVQQIVDIIGRMAHEEACDGVILGCTELPLIINDANSPIPALDSTRLLARAALRRAISQ